MKRILFIMMSCILLFTLTACTISDNESHMLISSDTTEETNEPLAGEIQYMQSINTVSNVQRTKPPLLKKPQVDTSVVKKPAVPATKEQKPTKTEDGMVPIQISVGKESFSVKLNDNPTTQALVAKMPMTLKMDDLNKNEKFYFLSKGLPTNSQRLSEIKAGDLMLYGSDCLVLFYESFSTNYSYTRLGKVDDPTGLAAALGKGSVEVTFKLQGKMNNSKVEASEQKKISVKADDITIVFELNDSPAAKDLYAQLPLTIEVENFSTNEKVFYPPKKLSTKNTPFAGAQKGSLCYYAPWGDVVMFYEPFGKGSGLYELGEVVSGKDDIENLSGTIEVTVAN